MPDKKYRSIDETSHNGKTAAIWRFVLMTYDPTLNWLSKHNWAYRKN